MCVGGGGGRCVCVRGCMHACDSVCACVRNLAQSLMFESVSMCTVCVSCLLN